MRSAIAIILLLIYLPSAAADHITIFTHNLSGQAECEQLTCKGKLHQGKRSFYVEVINELTSYLHYDNSMREVSFKRGLHNVQRHDNMVFFAVQRTPERENTVKWVGPISQAEDYFYEWQGRPTGIQKIEDAKNLRVCVLNGSVHDSLLSEMHFTKLSRNSSYSNCFKMLKLNRVDLAITSNDTLQDKLAETNIPLQLVRQTSVLVLSGNIYIALSNNISDQEVNKWNSALQNIKNAGKFDELTALYLNPSVSRHDF
ncbi:substrate-binding periplasmic protein [Psychromonas ossibalaenae]|uniref:substrate-binding periplasmic protein n=1 Tax=Psychromonas ossibalaenae TaxID=444922 RepID=UPI0003649037|nr:transporter substrate-binding domain-containing protein [Psychromonas ossibalaenae]